MFPFQIFPKFWLYALIWCPMAKTSKGFTFSLRSRWARRQRRYSWHNGHQRTPRTPWTSWRRRRNGTWRSSGSQRGAWFGRKTWASGLSRSSWAPRQAWVWRQWGLRCKYFVLRQTYFQKNSSFIYIYIRLIEKSPINIVVITWQTWLSIRIMGRLSETGLSGT